MLFEAVVTVQSHAVVGGRGQGNLPKRKYIYT